MGKTLKERFDEKWDKNKDGCWVWNARIEPNGYGKFWMPPKLVWAHRAAMILYREPIPEGMQVNHKCDNPACVNPDHLYLGNQKANLSDMVRRGRSKRGEKHSMVKLTESQVWDIINSRTNRQTIADRYGITVSHVRQIRRRESWKHLHD